MLTLLVQGFGKSLEIFTLTLLGSLPLGLLVMFGRRSLRFAAALAREAVHLRHARHAPDAPAHGRLLRTVPALRLHAAGQLALRRGHRRLRHQLRGLLRGDLPRGLRVHPSRAVRGGAGARLHRRADLRAHPSSPDDPARAAARDERGHHAREGHLARLRHRHGRDVHPRQADRRLAQHARYAGARGGRTLYYVFNYIVAFAMERAERLLAYYQ